VEFQFDALNSAEMIWRTPLPGRRKPNCEESNGSRQCSNDRRRLLSSGAGAQGTPQTVELAHVDVQKLSAGYRASKVIGSSVVNDANETIGKIDDLLVSLDGKHPYAVLSIGGFLGMGTRLVVVPYETLNFADKKAILPGATKEGLKTLPAFMYAPEWSPWELQR
jgi:hypothetical protein